MFETFPMCEATPQIEVAAYELNCVRKEIQTKESIGLTKLYNEFHNKDSLIDNINLLRTAHRKLDLAVNASYGWNDIKIEHNFFNYEKGLFWTIDPESQKEIVNRLLALNHERYELENGG